ncbi:MAG: HAD hydrolase-like protein [Verrucomicrobiales bacterium]
MGGRLLLFDIDMTLLETGGAGIYALLTAFREVFTLPETDEIPLDLAGATDRGIYREFVAARGLGDSAPPVEEFFAVYHRHLEINLSSSTDGRALPGAIELLESLRRQGQHHPALLTGNTRKGAEAKLVRFGLDSYFHTEQGAYGDDHHDRNQLGPIALERVRRATGRAYAGKQVVVIGDTPKDIRCAKTIGAMAVAVATGKHGREALAKAGADLVLDSLLDPALQDELSLP